MISEQIVLKTPSFHLSLLIVRYFTYRQSLSDKLLMLTPIARTMLGRGLGSLCHFIKYLFNRCILLLIRLTLQVF